MDEVYIYVISANEAGPVKIGFSKNPEARLRQLQTGHASPLKLFHKELIEGYDVRHVEKTIHKQIRYKRISGEWFSLPVEDAISEVKHGLIVA